jgi:hypothetical protein
MSCRPGVLEVVAQAESGVRVEAPADRRRFIPDAHQGLGRDRGLGSVVNVELAHQRSHVGLDRGFGDAEVEGDLLVEQSRIDAFQTFIWVGVRPPSATPADPGR